MSDIFISYASADRDWARKLADVLTEHGWSVWWDRVIPAGKQFDEVIEQALDSSKCVVVLWSPTSVGSTWVKTEAAEAMRRKALIPAIIEEVKIPLEFRRLQAADLSHWQGDRTDPHLVQFFSAIEAEVGRPGHVHAEPAPAPSPAPKPDAVPPAPSPRSVEPPRTELPAPPQRKSSLPLVIGALVVVIIGGLGYAFYNERAKGIELAEKVAKDKAAQEQAERERQRVAQEDAARESERRKSEDARKAKAEAESAALAARRKAEEERNAREEAAGAAAREKAAAAASERKQASTSTGGALNLAWQDGSLRYVGTITPNGSNVTVRATVYDLRTSARIGDYVVSAMVQQGQSEYMVTANFAVPGDSTTPGPHTHTSQLLLRARPDGSLRLVQNCIPNGKCFPGGN